MWKAVAGSNSTQQSIPHNQLQQSSTVMNGLYLEVSELFLWWQGVLWTAKPKGQFHYRGHQNDFSLVCFNILFPFFFKMLLFLFCLSVCLSVCLSACLSVCLSVCLLVCLFVCFVLCCFHVVWARGFLLLFFFFLRGVSLCLWPTVRSVCFSQHFP